MKVEKQDRRILCNDTTFSLFAKIQIFFENFNVKSEIARFGPANLTKSLKREVWS